MDMTNDQPKRDTTEAMEIFDRLPEEKQAMVLAYLRDKMCEKREE